MTVPELLTKMKSGEDITTREELACLEALVIDLRQALNRSNINLNGKDKSILAFNLTLLNSFRRNLMDLKFTIERTSDSILQSARKINKEMIDNQEE